MEKKIKKYKRATVKIPTITEAPFLTRLRRENEQLIRHLERLERGPFGIKSLFKRNDC